MLDHFNNAAEEIKKGRRLQVQTEEFSGPLVSTETMYTISQRQ
jgi:hypothetical protein